MTEIAATSLSSDSKNTHAPGSTPEKTFWIMAIGGLGLRLALSPWWGHGPDMGTFIGWGRQLADVGLADFYAPDRWCDYLPGYLYVLWMLGHVPVSGWAEMATFKLPGMLADVATAYVIWKAVGPQHPRMRMAAAAIYLFSPAVILNSAIWGQVDGFHAFFIVLGLWLLWRHRLIASAAVLGFAIAIKPHAAVVLPVALVFALRRGDDWRRVVAAVVVVPFVFAATFLPFAGWSPWEVVPLIRQRFASTADQYQYATINAMNLWYLVGLNWAPDGKVVWLAMAPRIWAMILVGASCGLSLAWVAIRRKSDTLWQASAFLFLALFLFVTRAHERHVFPALAVLTVAVGRRPLLLAPLLVLTATYVVNSALSWRYLMPDSEWYLSARLCGRVYGFGICLANLASLAMIGILLWRERHAEADNGDA